MKLFKLWAVVVFIVLVPIQVCPSQDTDRIYQNGVGYAVSDKIEEAKVFFSLVLKIDPLDQYAGQALRIIDDLSNKKIKRETFLHLFKGISQTMDTRWNQAIEECNQALALNPQYAVIYLERGQPGIVKAIMTALLMTTAKP